MRLDALPAFDVADQQPGPRMAKPVAELRPRPPRVERHHDRTETGNREQDDGPLGQVAHRQCDAVALADAESAKVRGERGRGAEPAFIGHALVLEDEEGRVAVSGARHPGEHREAGRLVLPAARRDAAADARNRHRLHLELRAGRAQPPFYLDQRHRWPGRRGPGLVDRRGGARIGHVRHPILNPVCRCRFIGNDILDSSAPQAV